MGSRRSAALLLLLLAAAALLPPGLPQLSQPVASDSEFLAGRSESGAHLRERTAKEVEEFVFAKDHSGWKEKSECEVDVDLLWTKEMGASIYSTPVISDLFSDGQRDIVSATFVRYLDVLEGRNGDHLPGWPFQLDYSHFHTSPLLWDADSDGVLDLLFVSFNGEVIVLQEDGTPMHGHTHRIPPLRVKRDWYEGLEEVTLESEGTAGGGLLRRRRAQELGDLLGDFSPPSPADDWGIPNYGDDDDTEDIKTSMWGSDALTGTDEYYASWDVFGLPSEDHDEFDKPHADPIAQFAEGIVGKISFLDGEEHVMVDAHVLSTPVLADVDGDGGAELVCAVSYYYDKQYYADNDVESPEDEDIEMSKYVAGGVVAISLEDGPRKTTLWQIHLDLTTEQTINQATIYAPPVVVDVDGDGVTDVVVGTGLGYVYALRGTDGKLLHGFPAEMGPIQAGVATGDLAGTGSIDIVAVDTIGNLAAFNSKGETLWDRVLSGSVSQSPTLADLDEDGVLEVICATASGDVIVVNGKTGENFDNFPVRLGDRVISPVAILPFPEDWQSGEGGESGMPRLIVPSFDGLVYIVSSGTGCIDWVDIGEQSYSMPLIDDLDNNGYMDILVTTMNGNAFALQTMVPYDPILTWTEQNQCSRNGGTWRSHYQGVYVLPLSRSFRDVIGATTKVQFEIIDVRQTTGTIPRKYKIAFRSGRAILFEDEYTTPGIYTVTLKSPHRRQFASVMLQMTNEHGQLFCDTFSLSFNVYFFRILKWLLAAPFLLMGGALLAVDNSGRALPLSF